MFFYGFQAFCRLHGRHCHPDNFTARPLQLMDLVYRLFHILGLGVAHRLDPDRVLATHGQAPNLYFLRVSWTHLYSLSGLQRPTNRFCQYCRLPAAPKRAPGMPAHPALKPTRNRYTMARQKAALGAAHPALTYVKPLQQFADVVKEHQHHKHHQYHHAGGMDHPFLFRVDRPAPQQLHK